LYINVVNVVWTSILSKAAAKTGAEMAVDDLELALRSHRV